MVCTCCTFVACGNKGDDTEQNAEANYTILKTSVNNMADMAQYTEGFTMISNEKSKMEISLDESKFNPTGMTEEEKATFIEMYNTSIGSMNGTSADRYVLSYDKVNNKGYSVKQDITYGTQGEENATTSSFWLYEDEGSDYNLYTYSYDEGLETSYIKNKYVVDGEYYNNYLKELNEFVDDIKERISAESFEELKAELVESAQTEVGNINFDVDVKVGEKDGEYSLNICISATAQNFDMGIALVDSVEVKMEVGITYTKDYFKTAKTGFSMVGIMTQTFAEEDGIGFVGSLTNNVVMSMEEDLNFSNSYNSKFEPQFNDTDMKKEDFVDAGQLPVHMRYFVNGYQVKYCYYSMGDKVVAPEIEGIVDAENIKWYLDPECTVEFTAETYPSYDLDLYANVTLAQDKVFVVSGSYDTYLEFDEEEFLSYHIVHIESKYFGVVDSELYECAYVNGTLVEAGEQITLQDGILNIVVYISK